MKNDLLSRALKSFIGAKSVHAEVVGSTAVSAAANRRRKPQGEGQSDATTEPEKKEQ